MRLYGVKQRGEEGQEIVLFGVLLAVVIAAGAVLAVNLLWLRSSWTALQEAAFSAAAAGTLEVGGLPGARGLDPERAEEAARRLLAGNLAELPFVDGDAEEMARQAEIEVLNPPPGECWPDPLGGRCHEVPFVTLRVQMPVRLPWGGWPLTLPGRAVAEAGESPQ
jgi:hypothetical protein